MIEKEKADAKYTELMRGNESFNISNESVKKTIQDHLEEKAMADFEKSIAESEELASIPTIDKVNPLETITAEDLALERELEKAHENQSFDSEPVVTVKTTIENINLLRTHVPEYMPASTISELKDQVFWAKANGCDSIEATKELVRHVFRKDFDHIEKVVGYAIYQDVRVYIDGLFSERSKQDNMSIDQKTFGPHGK